MRTLVITSCTGQKKVSPENLLLQDDFLDIEHLRVREKELVEFEYSAGEMYTGMQHLRLMEGMEKLREHFSEYIVDLDIVSAGYGLINESERIVPYEVTFNSMKSSELVEWSKKLKIHQDLQMRIRDYDLVIFLLGDKYLRALQLPFREVDSEKRLVFLAGRSSRKLIPDEPPYYFIEVGQDDAKSFSYGLVGLKGYLFKLLVEDFVNKDQIMFDRIYDQPPYIMEILQKYRKDTR